ncbi:DNA-binding protein parB [Vibrio ichthyoenteri ATCC 700023]|uniref:DNA-binding protein parB n=1 Tax=Vibrio ichthyoenteri ATCC 700023 TaxID=870968 RepID=F9RZN2_9VIBR|nr:ParB N-terminal domain-containing protein [Vibrio ichthyoenteri]EGU44708.1 DNA-binding protein parB [Vibrio ichthyoenteri ATCC 700023]
MSNNALAKRLQQRKSAIENIGVHDECVATNVQNNLRKLKLGSGKLVELELRWFKDRCDIESSTAVDVSNIRDQEQLTAENLQDIISSIDDIQLYPAIGYLDDGIVKIVDGSRRRKAAIIKNCQYVVEVANCKLSLKDAEEIVRISEQKKKLSYVEWGRFYQAKLSQGIYPDAKTMADAEGVSTGYLSLCINAAKVPNELLNLFLDNSLIASQKHTKLLVNVTKVLQSRDIKLQSFIDDLEGELVIALENACTPEEHTELVCHIIGTAKDRLIRTPKNKEKDKLKVENLGRGVTFSIKSKDSAIINLRKVPDDKKKKIKDFIRELMDAES